MFNQLKQLKGMRDQAQELQKTLAQEKVEAEYQGNTMILNGKMELLELRLADDLMTKDKSEVEEILKELHSQAMTKTQQIVAGKMGVLGKFM